MGLPPNTFFDYQPDQQPSGPNQGLIALLQAAQGNASGLSQADNAPAQSIPTQSPAQRDPYIDALMNAPQQQQPPPANNSQNAGPVKAGLRHVLGTILGNFSYGAGQAMVKSAGLETDAEKALRMARMGQIGAETDLAGAQAENLRSEASGRRIQNRPVVLIDPQSGGPAHTYGPDGSIAGVRVGTMADQKELNDMFKATGGYMTLPAGLAASIGSPDLAGSKIPVNTFNSLMTSQSAKTVESEIVRLSQIEVAKGRDPNQSEAIQNLIGIKKALQNYTPEMADERYRQLYAKQHGGGQLSPDDSAWMKGYEKQKTMVPAARYNLQFGGGGLIPGAGAAGGGTIDSVPAAIRPQVQSILDYRQPMPPMGRNNPTNQALQYWVNTLDPQYDATTFPARNKILGEYVKDAGDGQLGAINTALGHLGELFTAAKALEGGDLPLLHSIAAKVGAASGGDAATTYQMILHRVSPEMTAAYVKGGGGESERGANEGDFGINKGSQQIISNIAESAKLLRSKLASKENNWNNTFKPTREEDKFENRWLTPEAQQTLDSLSLQAPTSKNAQPKAAKFDPSKLPDAPK